MCQLRAGRESIQHRADSLRGANMRIQDHLLFHDNGQQVPFKATPNHGAALNPSYLVMHYTAGRSFQSSVDWFMRPEAKASAHIVIGRGGEICQLVPFDKQAWHAGVSNYGGLVGLNKHSIGIELDDAGKLTRQGGKWTAWFGATYPDTDVLEATHEHETRPAGWHIYTEPQMTAAIDAGLAIVSAYGLVDVLGHDDIAIGRKTDPGPAFPKASYRAKLFGRNQAVSFWDRLLALFG